MSDPTSALDVPKEPSIGVPLGSDTLPVPGPPPPSVAPTPPNPPTKEDFPKAKVPFKKAPPDIAKIISITTNCATSTGKKLIVDVIPDVRNVVKSIIFHVGQLYSEFDVRDTPSASPLSIVCYLLMLFYAHLLFSDYYFRTPISNWADEFMTCPLNKRLFDTLLAAPCPEFMLTIINGLCNAKDARRPNVRYIASLASFSLLFDYGRLLPPSMFLIAHNIVATMSARTSPSDVRNAFFFETVLSIVNPPSAYRIGNLLGTNFDNATNILEFANWMNETIMALFNPVVMRNLQNRPFISPVEFRTPSSPDFNSVNPYEYLLMADRENIGSTIDFASSMSKFFSTHDPTSVPFSQLINKMSGNAILCHAVSILPMPTWSSGKVASTASTLPALKSSKKDFAAHYAKYLLPRASISSVSPMDPSAPATSTGSSASFRNYYFADESKMTDAQLNATDTDTIILFDIRDHVTPPVRFFDPTGTDVSKLIYPIICGLKIEFFELDGFTVPLPNMSIDLSTDNSWFLQSCIPLSSILQADDPLIAIRDRTRHSAINQPVRGVLYDMSKNIIRRISHTVLSAFDTALSVFTAATPPVVEPHRLYDGFAYTIPTTSSNSHKIPLWSSYRYVSAYSGDNMTRIHMNASLRTVYGTNVTLVESEFPPSLIVI